MLLEKSKNKIEFMKNAEKIIQNIDNLNIEKLKNIMQYKAHGILKQEEIEKLLEKINYKKEENNMTLAERIRKNEREEKKRIREEAIIEGINRTIKKMLLLKTDESFIKEVTGIKDKELEKIKKELLEV